MRVTNISNNFFWVNRCSKRRNRCEIESFAVLVENLEQIAANIKEKRANQENFFRGGIGRIYLSLSNKWNYFSELSTAGHVMSKRQWKSSFDFTEIINKHELLK